MASGTPGSTPASAKAGGAKKLSPRGAVSEDSPATTSPSGAGDAWHQLYGECGSIEDRFPNLTGQARLNYVLQVYGNGGAARDIVLFRRF